MTRRGLISNDSLMSDHPANTADQPEDVATLRAALLAAEARIAALEQIIHSFKRARFGQSAERIDTAQLALTLGQDPPPSPANDPAASSPSTSHTHHRRKGHDQSYRAQGGGQTAVTLSRRFGSIWRCRRTHHIIVDAES